MRHEIAATFPPAEMGDKELSRLVCAVGEKAQTRLRTRLGGPGPFPFRDPPRSAIARLVTAFLRRHEDAQR